MISSSTLPPGDYKKLDNFIYSLNAILGEGSYGKVYKGYDESNDYSLVAVKVMPTALILKDEEELRYFMRELSILTQMKSPHVVQMFRAKETKNHVYIFMEYCNGGDLAGKLAKSGALPEEEALDILRQIADAFVSLSSVDYKNGKGHKVAIMHRDIKRANILFHDGVVKLADFGYAKMVDEAMKNKKQEHTSLGSPYYTNPQTLSADVYSAKCDVWSAGCVFYECLFGKTPWKGTSLANLYYNIVQTPLDFPKSVSAEVKDLLTKMLQIKEENRLDWAGVAAHPLLAKKKKKIAILKQYGDAEINQVMTTATKALN